MARPVRDTAILALVATAAALAAFGGWRFARASAPITGPVVLISVDALRADRLAVYGHTQGRTPAIDALAADGVVFDRAYSNSPLTLPSHTSLLSGRLPFATGVRNNAGFVVDDRHRMLAEILRDRGYATGAVVSSFALGRATGIAQGFTFFDDGLSGAGQDVQQAIASSGWRDDAASEQIAERWLTSTRSPRAFLFLHLFGPHRPRETGTKSSGAQYDAAVADADEAIGRLVKYLKAHQLYDQSTIILVSDHGEGLGDHGEEAHGVLVYDEVLRVPFIVKPAASEESGRRVSHVVQLADITPTVLDLAKAPVPDNLAGRSLTPLLAGDDDFPARIVYSESMYPYYAFGWSGLTTVTDGRFRYITPAGPQDPPYETPVGRVLSDPTGAELFDHETDPREQSNLVGGREPAALVALREALTRLTANAPAPAPTIVSEVDHERYEAIGDVGARSTSRASARTPSTLAEALASGAPIHPRTKVALVNVWREAASRARMRDWTGAMTHLRAALQLEPARADLWAALAQAAVAVGREDDGLAALRRLEDLDPTPMVASYLDARILQARGRHVEAAVAFDLALAGADAPGGRTIAGLRSSAAESLKRLHRHEEAEYLFLGEMRRFPHNVRARAGLASLYQITRRNDEAEAVLNDLVRQIPTADAYDHAARVWAALGQHTAASAARLEARRLGH